MKKKMTLFELSVLVFGGYGAFVLLTATEDFGRFSWSSFFDPQEIEVIEAGFTSNHSSTQEARPPLEGR